MKRDQKRQERELDDLRTCFTHLNEELQLRIVLSQRFMKGYMYSISTALSGRGWGPCSVALTYGVR